MEGLKFATLVAKQSDVDVHKIGCALTDKKDNLISFGFNKMKTHPKQAEFALRIGLPNKIFLHAEISALIRCGDKIPYRAYVARVRKSGTLGLAKPCSICTAALYEAGVKEIFYTENEEVL